MTQESQWLGTTQASRLLEVRPKTLLGWLEKGLLPNIHTRTLPTGRVQLNRADVEAYVQVLNNEGK